MASDTLYKKLCSVDLFHHYHLDDGLKDFDVDPATKAEQLKGYNFNSFAHVVPANISQREMRGRKLFYKPTARGFELLVAAQETAPDSGIYTTVRGIAEQFMVYILVYIKDPLFENYSTVSPVVDQPFYFSNKEPDTHAGAFNYIDVSTTKNIEDFTISTESYGPVAALLEASELRGLFGVIALSMKGDDTLGIDGDVRDLLETNGELVATPPEFKIQFANRATIWNYRSADDGSLLHSSDPATQPLVKRGIVGYSFDGKDRPAARPDRLIYEKDINGNIIKTFSEIYI